jgi:osmotically inducible protein OsmC
MHATGKSTWTGSWKHGHGTISTESDTILKVAYSYASRFEGATGASPEELLCASHAGCFNQALANNFGMIDFEATTIDTSITVEFGTGDDGHPAIFGLNIMVEAIVPSITEERFQYCAERARANCTISKIIKCPITMSAKLLPG